MALLRAATDQLLSAKVAPWMQHGFRIVSRSFAAQAEPVQEDDGAYVVTARTVRVLLCSAGLLFRYPCIIVAVFMLVFAYCTRSCQHLQSCLAKASAVAAEPTDHPWRIPTLEGSSCRLICCMRCCRRCYRDEGHTAAWCSHVPGHAGDHTP
jgi:hypothetical protein